MSSGDSTASPVSPTPNSVYGSIQNIGCVVGSQITPLWERGLSKEREGRRGGGGDEERADMFSESHVHLKTPG